MLRMSPCTDLSTAGLPRSKQPKRPAISAAISRASRQQQQQQRRRAVRFTSASRSLDSDDSPAEASTSACASANGGGAETEWLVAMGPSPRLLFKSKPPSSLLMASSAGDAQWLKQSLTSSAHDDVNQLGPEGLSPLHTAAKHGHLACVEVLLAWKGTDITITTAPDARTALHLAIDAKRQRVQCLRVLLQAGVPVNQGDWNSTTALHAAAGLGRVACMMALLEAGADTRALDKLKRQPLDVAKWSGKGECVRRLRALGWASEKTHAEDAKRRQAYSNEMQCAQRGRQQKLEQAIRGEEAFDDWLATKGLASSSCATLSTRHTTSSLLRISGGEDGHGAAATTSSSLAGSRASSRLSSKFNSMWSVVSAPATMRGSGSSRDHDAVSRLTSPSLPAMLGPPDPPAPTASKPIRLSFHHKHQHRESQLITAKKSQHSGSSPKSTAKRPRHVHAGSASLSRRKDSRQRPLPRASTPHPSLSNKELLAPHSSRTMQESTLEEAMTGDANDADPDLPKLRIEELLLKDRHQLPTLKPLAWGSGHQLLDHSGDNSPGTGQSGQSTPTLPVFRPLRANSLRLAVLRTTNLEVVDEEGESASSSVSDIDAYLGPTHSCLQLQCANDMASTSSLSSCTTSDISLHSTDMLDRMSLSDD